jgi:hypothetical protein
MLETDVTTAQVLTAYLVWFVFILGLVAVMIKKP